MTHLTPVPDQSAPTETPGTDPIEPGPAKSRPRTTHPLPTDRIPYSRQLEILRAFAIAAADNNGTASNNNVGEIVKMSHKTVALATPFFVDAGLLARADRGRFRPAEAVTEYSRAYSWTPDRAGHHLGALLRRSWFGQIIIPRVSVNARDEDEVLSALSSAAGATTEHRQQLAMVLEFALLGGIVQRDGSRLMQGNGTVPAQTGAPTATTAAPIAPAARPQPGVEEPGTTTGFEKNDTEGYVQFHVNVKVKTAEFAGWRPERISAFFGGIAQVLAAKGRMEEDDGSSG